MQQTSALWREIFADPNHKSEYRAMIAGVLYGEANLQVQNIERPLCTASALIGTANAATLTLALLPQGSIPRMADIVLETRLVCGERASEWLSLGTFYIDTREKQDDVMTLTCYDAMLKAEQPFVDEELEQGSWPITMQAAVAEIARRMGVRIDARTVINPNYWMEYPNDLTMRECLGSIAAAHGGNWCITPASELRLVPLFQSGAAYALGTRAAPPMETGTAVTISRVTLWFDDDNAFTAGDDTGYHLETDCIWATQAMADDLLAALGGRTYVPFEAAEALLDPAVELGDPITLAGISSSVQTMDITPDALFSADITAPHEQEVDHEYPYLGRIERELKRRVSLGKAYYGVSISRKKGLEVKKSDGSSEAIFNSDVLSMRAMIDGKMVDCIYFDPTMQKYRLTGDVQIDGSISSDATITDALYAEQGDIAQLTVDWIDTSKRIAKYLSEDTSDDNYFEGHDRMIAFVTARVVLKNQEPLTEQMKNRYGETLYWKADIADAEIRDGYPYDAEGKRIYVTTERTDWPVVVYQYERLTKRSIQFVEDATTGSYMPVDVFGAGSGRGESEQGKIVKTSTGFNLVYTTTQGVPCGVYMANDGFVDVTHRRADVTINTGKQAITIRPEGMLASPFDIGYVEEGDTLTLTWPDGKSFKVAKT